MPSDTMHRRMIRLFDWAGPRMMHDAERAVEAVERLPEPFTSTDVMWAISGSRTSPVTMSTRVLHDLRLLGLVIPVSPLPYGPKAVRYVRKGSALLAADDDSKPPPPGPKPPPNPPAPGKPPGGPKGPGR